MKYTALILALGIISSAHASVSVSGYDLRNSDGINSAFNNFGPTPTPTSTTFALTGATAEYWMEYSDQDFNGNGDNTDDGTLTVYMSLVNQNGTAWNNGNIAFGLADGESALVSVNLDTSALTGTVDTAAVGNFATLFSSQAVEIVVGSSSFTHTGGVATLSTNAAWSIGDYRADANSATAYFTINNDTGSTAWLRSLSYAATVATSPATVTVPEPSAIALLGLGGLVAIGRRRR